MIVCDIKITRQVIVIANIKKKIIVHNIYTLANIGTHLEVYVCTLGFLQCLKFDKIYHCPIDHKRRGYSKDYRSAGNHPHANISYEL